MRQIILVESKLQLGTCRSCPRHQYSLAKQASMASMNDSFRGLPNMTILPEKAIPGSSCWWAMSLPRGNGSAERPEFPKGMG